MCIGNIELRIRFIQSIDIFAICLLKFPIRFTVFKADVGSTNKCMVFGTILNPAGRCTHLHYIFVARIRGHL